MTKLYQPLSLLVSVLSGLIAGPIFKRIRKLVAGEDGVPKASDARRGWPDAGGAPT